LSKSIAIEPGLLDLLQKVAGVRFFWDTVYMCGQLTQGCYLAVLWARVNPGTFRSPVWPVTVRLPSHTVSGRPYV